MPETDQPAPDAGDKTDDPLAAARALLAQDEQDRMSACLAEIEQVLSRHGMQLTVTPARITISPA